MISVSIDTTKIQKERIKDFKKKDGSIAKYLEIILIETPNGQYGDFMVKQSVSKEEREKRVEMPILGNGKILGGNKRQPSAPVQQPEDDQVPF